MKFYVLDLGYEKLDKSALVAGCTNAKTYNPEPKAIWQKIPIQAYLIEHPEGYILFDTGCDPDFKTNWPAFIEEDSPYYVTEEQLLLNRLAQLNVKPEDIKYVVISHLHVDHAGGLKNFKNATVYVNDEEFTATVCNYVKGEDLNVHVPCDIEAFIQAKLKWRTVMPEEKELELVPGVTLLNFGSGHSWGMLGMKVELENTGNLLCVADSVYMKDNLYPNIRIPGIIYDSVGYVRTAKFILDYIKKNDCKLLYGHDIEQFDTLIKSQDGYYD